MYVNEQYVDCMSFQERGDGRDNDQDRPESSHSQLTPNTQKHSYIWHRGVRGPQISSCHGDRNVQSWYVLY